LIAGNGHCADTAIQNVQIRGFDGESEPLQLTNVTVQNNEVIKLNWEAHPWAENYQVFRKLKGEEMQPAFTTEATTFTDRQANVHENRYFYRIRGMDSCGNLSAPSNMGRNILLQGKNQDNDVAELWWNPYENWETGIREYELEKAGHPHQLELLTVDHDTAHKDPEFFDPTIDSQYYRIHAIQKRNPDVQSTSNILGLPLIPKLYVPTAFSPNNDGHNEVFRVQTTGVHNFTLKIFSRWGEKVFETNDPDEGWDGTYQGEMVPAGVYMYTVQGEGNTYEQFSREGTINLIR
jgi:gliding motility-associated-like protein